MTLVSIMIAAASILASGMLVFFGIGYIAYRKNKRKNYYPG